MKIENVAELKINILSGFTVALALVPEAIAFAPPQSGLSGAAG